MNRYDKNLIKNSGLVLVSILIITLGFFVPLIVPLALLSVLFFTIPGALLYFTLNKIANYPTPYMQSDGKADEERPRVAANIIYLPSVKSENGIDEIDKSLIRA